RLGRAGRGRPATRNPHRAQHDGGNGAASAAGAHGGDRRAQAMRARGGERGFALLAVLLVLAMLGVLGAEFAYSMRLEASAVRSYKDGITAGHLAEAAIAQAIRELASDWAFVVADDRGELTFYTRDRLTIVPPARQEVTLGPGQFSYRLRDEEALLNVNTSQPGRLETLLDT